MLVHFRNSRLRKLCLDPKELRKKYGQRNAEEIQAVIAELEAAANMNAIPPCLRPHPLSGNLDGKYAADLAHPFRLIFEPFGKFTPHQVASIVEVRVIEIVDYH